MCDPSSWVKPLCTNKYILHRVIGQHSKYKAPNDFFTELTPIIKKLIDTKFFSALSTGIENDNNSFNCINNIYKNDNITLPLFIQSRNDKELIKFLKHDYLSTIQAYRIKRTIGSYLIKAKFNNKHNINN